MLKSLELHSTIRMIGEAKKLPHLAVKLVKHTKHRNNSNRETCIAARRGRSLIFVLFTTFMASYARRAAVLLSPSLNVVYLLKAGKTINK